MMRTLRSGASRLSFRSSTSGIAEPRPGVDNATPGERRDGSPDALPRSGSIRTQQSTVSQARDTVAGQSSSSAARVSRSPTTRWQRFNRWASSAIKSGARNFYAGRQSGDGDYADGTGERRSRRTNYAMESLGLREDKRWRRMVMRHLLPKVSTFALHPHQPSMRTWNCLMLLLLIIEAPLLPWQVAFISDERLLQLPWLLWFRLWVELIFWLDTAIQFFLQIQPDDRTYWISDVRQIAWKYARSRFLIDLAAVLPLKGLIVAIWGVPSGQCDVSLVGFHRLLRFARWPRVVNTLQTHHEAVLGRASQFKYKTKRLAKAFTLVLFVTHVMGCVWASLAFCPSEDASSWFDYLAHVNSDNALYSKGNPTGIYLCSLYWAVFTLTGVGYGDVVPFSSLEYIVVILCMVVASLTWAWVTATIVSIVGSMQQTVNDHLHTLDYVNELLRDNRVQAGLGRRLREYFTKMKDVKLQDSVCQIIDELSPELRIEVVYAVHGAWIEKVWWMKKLPPGSEFMVELTQNMKATLHTPNETIPNRPELIVIRRGLCIRGGHLMTSGQVFGEDLLLNNEALRKPYITLVLTFLHVLVVTKSVFESVLLHHPEVAPCVRKAFVTYAVMRGILHYADMLRNARKRAAFQSEVQSEPQSQDAAPKRRASTGQARQGRAASLASRRPATAVVAGALQFQRPVQPTPSQRRTVTPVARIQQTRSGRAFSPEPPPSFGRAISPDGSQESRESLAGEVIGLMEQLENAEGQIHGRLRGLEGLMDMLMEQAQALSGGAARGGPS